MGAGFWEKSKEMLKEVKVESAIGMLNSVSFSPIIVFVKLLRKSNFQMLGFVDFLL